jgi:hypothetical protein
VKGVHGGPHPAGARVGLDPDYVVASVRETGPAVRFDTDDPAAAGVPQVVRAVVEVTVETEERLPEPLEVAACHVVAEALASVAKHA